MGFTVIKEELPRTALKKIKRYQVRQQYLQEEAPQPEPKTQELKPEDLGTLNKELAEKVMYYLFRELKKPVSLDSHLEIDLGVDSLTRVQLGLGLEALLNLKIPDEALFSISTVREVITKLQDLTIATPSLKEAKGEQKTWAQILKEPPPEAIVKRIKLRPSLLEILFVAIFKSAILFIFRIFWRLSIKGKESLPQDGPYIICPNHASYLDGLFVSSSLPLKIALKTFFIGYSEIFESPAVSWAIKIARLIPIDANVHLTETMQAISFVLKQHRIVCFFPEGRRSIDENLGEFKKGAGILIKELEIPVVPVYIKGSHYSWPRGVRTPHLYPIKVIFGRPVSLKELLREGKDAESADDYEAIAKGLRKEVLKLAC
ncbi:MAG: 1-acyl-sn-glycerol-3-phosphate acyltransferase [Candidatus Omnitrophica bacterium]|nr:1-acyl-sn-glycerol-3-phosphate acyltransferase [Candidatus Omnitrophota bacterium]